MLSKTRFAIALSESLQAKAHLSNLAGQADQAIQIFLPRVAALLFAPPPQSLR